MDAGDKAFGWARSFSSQNIGKTKITATKPGDGDFTVTWYDTWSGKTVKSDEVKSVNGKLELIVPELTDQNRDIAFKISKL
jgi:hypothetical protein